MTSDVPQKPFRKDAVGMGLSALSWGSQCAEQSRTVVAVAATTPRTSAAVLTPLQVARWTLVFAGLGIFVRLIRWGQRFELSLDEFMLCANFTSRTFSGLLQPLDYDQVAPVPFLWMELAVTRLLGFSEWSLRLFPLFCGIAALLLFRHIARRLLTGLPLVMAVGVFSVSKSLIGHSADVKPYASDLLCSLVLLACVVEWSRRRSRSTWLWVLAAVTPLLVVSSFPAVFIAGGIALGLMPILCFREGLGWKNRAAGLLFCLTLCSSFLLNYVCVVRHQYSAARQFMTSYWEQAFPPWQTPAELPGWLLDVHTGDTLFAHPVGAPHGGSTATFVCFLVGCGCLIRQRQYTLVAMLLGPFALNLLAAGLHAYPYGGHVRLVQHLAPAICLLGGLGLGEVLSRLAGQLSGERTRQRAGWLVVPLFFALACLGIGVLARGFAKPYQHGLTNSHRNFARWLWESQPEFLTVCARNDLGMNFATRPYYAEYDCHRSIYSPRHNAGKRVTETDLKEQQRPFRCVVFHPPGQAVDQPAYQGWLANIQSQFRLGNHSIIDLQFLHDRPHCVSRYEILHFFPRNSSAPPTLGNDVVALKEGEAFGKAW